MGEVLSALAPLWKPAHGLHMHRTEEKVSSKLASALSVAPLASLPRQAAPVTHSDTLAPGEAS